VKIKKTITQRRRHLALVLRNLERKGLIVSSLDPDGKTRWRVTEKGRHTMPVEVEISDELLN